MGDVYKITTLRGQEASLSAPEVGTNQIEDSAVTTDKIADNAVTPDKINYYKNATYGTKFNGVFGPLVKILVEKVSLYNYNNLLVNSVQYIYANVFAEYMNDLGASTPLLQQGTVVDTFETLNVYDLKSEAGNIHEGIFTIYNEGSEAVTIPAETVFLTGLNLTGTATYTCYILTPENSWGWDLSATLEQTDGKTLNFTTDVSIPATTSVHVYVVSNGRTQTGNTTSGDNIER